MNRPIRLRRLTTEDPFVEEVREMYSCKKHCYSAMTGMLERALVFVDDDGSALGFIGRSVDDLAEFEFEPGSFNPRDDEFVVPTGVSL